MQNQIETPLEYLLEAFIRQERSHQQKIQELNEHHRNEIKALNEHHRNEIKALNEHHQDELEERDERIAELKCRVDPYSSEGRAICNSELD
jgi:predicted metal-dependent hydrolase